MIERQIFSILYSLYDRGVLSPDRFEQLTHYLFITAMLGAVVGVVGVPIRLVQMCRGSILRHFARLTRPAKGVVLLSAVVAVPMLFFVIATLYEIFETATCSSNCAQGGVGALILGGDFGLLYILFECLFSPITYAQITASPIAKTKP
jgi:hypothetical protein